MGELKVMVTFHEENRWQVMMKRKTFMKMNNKPSKQPIIIPTKRIADSHPFLAGVSSKSHSEELIYFQEEYTFSFCHTCRGQEEGDAEDLNGVTGICPATDECQPVVEPAIAGQIKG